MISNELRQAHSLKMQIQNARTALKTGRLRPYEEGEVEFRWKLVDDMLKLVLNDVYNMIEDWKDDED